MRRVRTATLIVPLTLCCVGITATPAQAKNASQPVGGGFTTAPCAITSFVPVPGSPTTGRFVCASTSQWTGTWTGITTLTAAGRLNLVTGEAEGTADETFAGRASDGSTGSLHVSDVFTIGADGYLRDVAVIISGTGDWVGAAGRAVFDGFNYLGPGYGGYHGSWSRGK
ncbi:MAG: hypothetical protein ACYDH6_00120 [Acidimicrobiales bacterium]